MTRSDGTPGLIFAAEAGSPVIRTMADRIAARSTIGRDAGEVLKHDPAGNERDLDLAYLAGVVGR